MPVATPIARIELSRDRWVRIHLPSVKQQLAILDLPGYDEGEEKARDRVRAMGEMFSENQVETSWGGDVMDGLVLTEIEPFGQMWVDATEEDAVPLASASAGESPPSEPQSAAQTGGRSKSPRRRSSRS